MPTLRRRAAGQAPPPHSDDAGHPAGSIRLGISTLTRVPFDVPVPSGIVQHVTLLGLTGSGKTTTAERLAEGATASGLSLVVIDAKGASLLVAARGFDHREVVPGESTSLGYNPCALGTRAQV